MPLPGDIFVLQPDDDYLFGRVIGAELSPDESPMPGRTALVYIYEVRSDAKVPDLEALTPDRLLIPPAFVNRVPWTSGYFEPVAHEELTPAHRLPQHCFRDRLRNQFVNERNERLPAEVVPCGTWALTTYLGIDYEVSRALGLPRPWDEEG